MSTQIEVTVLKSVKVSDDGIHNRWIIAGATDTVPEDSFAGLEREGFVSIPSRSEDAPVQGIPAEALRIEPVGAGWFAIFRGDERVAKGFRTMEAAEAALRGMNQGE